MDIEILIRNKIKGQLSLEEEKTFEVLIKSDSSFYKAYKSHLDMHLAIKESEKDRLKQQLNTFERTYQKKNSKLWFGISGVAVVIVLFIFFNPFFNSSHHELYKQYFSIYPNTYQPVVRGETNPLTLAFMTYENGDYSKAVNLFKRLLIEKEDKNVRFYYAMSLLYLENTEKALLEFNKLEAIHFQYQKQVLWYKGLLLLNSRKTKQAKQVFENLRSKFPEYKSVELKNILSNLN